MKGKRIKLTLSRFLSIYPCVEIIIVAVPFGLFFCFLPTWPTLQLVKEKVPRTRIVGIGSIIMEKLVEGKKWCALKAFNCKTFQKKSSNMYFQNPKLGLKVTGSLTSCNLIGFQKGHVVLRYLSTTTWPYIWLEKAATKIKVQKKSRKY